MNHRRRALVLGSEGARHPFRQTLPPHVLSGVDFEPGWRARLALSAAEWKRFFATYCAGFVAVSAFIA